jgi:hypothetical protein
LKTAPDAQNRGEAVAGLPGDRGGARTKAIARAVAERGGRGRPLRRRSNRRPFAGREAKAIARPRPRTDQSERIREREAADVDRTSRVAFPRPQWAELGGRRGLAGEDLVRD